MRERKVGKGFAGLSSMLSHVDDALVATGDENPSPHKPQEDPGSQNTDPIVESTAAEPPPVTASARRDYVAPQPTGRATAAKWIVGVGVAIGVLWLFHVASGPSSVDRTAGQASPSAAPVSASRSPDTVASIQTAGFEPSLAIAAIKANLRAEPFPKAKIVRVLSRGEKLQIGNDIDAFWFVHLADGTSGWVAKELAIPVADEQRLQRLTAQQYVEQRASEGRLKELVRQREPQMKAFLVALYQIANRSTETLATLDELENAKAYTLVPDEPTAVWYGLSAKAAAAVGNFEEAAWNSRAAIEADPTNPDHHIALALNSFEAGNYEVTKAVAKIVPFLAPRTTNAWVVLGLAEALDEKDGQESTATGAFVLAVRLSRNPAFTRKYLSDLSTKSTVPRVRQMTALAVAEEKANPSLFLTP
jgi:hypothetical protein